MKKLINISFSFLLFSFIGFFGIFAHVSAQNGAWISQTISQNMDGWWWYDCGETVAALTRQYSRYIYFFDINSSQWSVVDFGSTQTVRKFAVKGNCAMAYTDSLIVGYSAITSQWDTLYYQGQVLDPEPSWSGSPSWGAGENLAYFVTNSAAYIFDTELGQWQTFQYSIPFTYQSNNGRFWSRGDYAGIILSDYGQNLYYNLAYSLHAHAFSELSDGGYYQDSDWKFDHGYVAHWDDGSTYKIISYTAGSNSFSTIALSIPPNMSTQNLDPNNIIERTVFVFSYIEEISHPNYRLHSLGFDTRTGIWMEDIWDYNENDWAIKDWRCGGQIAMLACVDLNNNNRVTLRVFSGQGSSFHDYTPGILYDINIGQLPLGGTVLAYYDTSYIWFHSITTETSHIIPVNGIEYATANSVMSKDFTWVNFNLNANPDSTYSIYFNEAQNSVNSMMLPRFADTCPSTPFLATFNLFFLNKKVYLYSGIVNDYSVVNFPSAVQASQIHAKGKLAAVKTSDYLAIYDATTNSTHTETYSYYSDPSLGAHVAVIQRNNILQAYSTITHQWYEFTIPNGIGSWAASDYLGRCESLGIDDRYYAFNGFNGNLVELQPQGNWVNGVNTKMGAKTILVVRDSIIYAFDPQAVTGISNPNSVSPLPTTFHLEQNYPNPFNPSTTIRYSLPQSGFVQLKVYDLLGKEVASLVNKEQALGNYKIEFTAKNLSSGVYFYRLQSGSFTETKKLILLR